MYMYICKMFIYICMHACTHMFLAYIILCVNNAYIYTCCHIIITIYILLIAYSYIAGLQPLISKNNSRNSARMSVSAFVPILEEDEPLEPTGTASRGDLFLNIAGLSSPWQGNR